MDIRSSTAKWQPCQWPLLVLVVLICICEVPMPSVGQTALFRHQMTYHCNGQLAFIINDIRLTFPAGTTIENSNSTNNPWSTAAVQDCSTFNQARVDNTRSSLPVLNSPVIMCSGTLSDNIVYYVNGGVRYPFLDEATYFAWGFTWSLLNTVNCGISGFLPMGEAMPRPTVYRCNNQIWFITGGTRRLFSNEVYASWGSPPVVEDCGPVNAAAASTRADMPLINNPLRSVTCNGDQGIFMVSHAMVRRSFSAELIASLGLQDRSRTTTIDCSILTALPTGREVRAPGFYKCGDRFWWVSGGVRREIARNRLWSYGYPNATETSLAPDDCGVVQSVTAWPERSMPVLSPSGTVKCADEAAVYLLEVQRGILVRREFLDSATYTAHIFPGRGNPTVIDCPTLKSILPGPPMTMPDGPPGYTMAAGRIPMVSACATVINWPWTKSRETNPLATRCRDWNCCRQLCDANANCNAFAFGFQRVDLLPQDLCHWTGNDCCFTFSLSGSCQSSSTWMLNNYDTYTRMTGVYRCPDNRIYLAIGASAYVFGSAQDHVTWGEPTPTSSSCMGLDMAGATRLPALQRSFAVQCLGQNWIYAIESETGVPVKRQYPDWATYEAWNSPNRGGAVSIDCGLLNALPTGPDMTRPAGCFVEVTFVGPNNTDGTSLELSEISLFYQDGTQVPPASLRASLSTTGLSASSCIDGITATRCSSTTADPRPRLRVEYPCTSSSQQLLGRVTLYRPTDRINRFQIQVWTSQQLLRYRIPRADPAIDLLITGVAITPNMNQNGGVFSRAYFCPEPTRNVPGSVIDDTTLTVADEAACITACSVVPGCMAYELGNASPLTCRLKTDVLRNPAGRIVATPTGHKACLKLPADAQGFDNAARPPGRGLWECSGLDGRTIVAEDIAPILTLSDQGASFPVAQQCQHLANMYGAAAFSYQSSSRTCRLQHRVYGVSSTTLAFGAAPTGGSTVSGTSTAVEKTCVLGPNEPLGFMCIDNQADTQGQFIRAITGVATPADCEVACEAQAGSGATPACNSYFYIRSGSTCHLKRTGLSATSSANGATGTWCASSVVPMTWPLQGTFWLKDAATVNSTCISLSRSLDGSISNTVVLSSCAPMPLINLVHEVQTVPGAQFFRLRFEANVNPGGSARWYCLEADPITGNVFADFCAAATDTARLQLQSWRLGSDRRLYNGQWPMPSANDFANSRALTYIREGTASAPRWSLRMVPMTSVSTLWNPVARCDPGDQLERFARNFTCKLGKGYKGCPLRSPSLSICPPRRAVMTAVDADGGDAFLKRIFIWPIRNSIGQFSGIGAMRFVVGNTARTVGNQALTSNMANALAIPPSEGTKFEIAELRLWYGTMDAVDPNSGDVLIGRIWMRSLWGDEQWSVGDSNLYPLAQPDARWITDVKEDITQVGSGKLMGAFVLESANGIHGFGLHALKIPLIPNVMTLTLTDLDEQFRDLPPAEVIQYTVDNSESSVELSGSCVEKSVEVTKETTWGSAETAEETTSWLKSNSDSWGRSDTAGVSAETMIRIGNDDSFVGAEITIGAEYGLEVRKDGTVTTESSGETTKGKEITFEATTSETQAITFPAASYTLPPGMIGVCVFMYAKAVLNLPYIGTMITSFPKEPGSGFNFEESWSYSWTGVYKDVLTSRGYSRFFTRYGGGWDQGNGVIPLPGTNKTDVVRKQPRPAGEVLADIAFTTVNPEGKLECPTSAYKVLYEDLNGVNSGAALPVYPCLLYTYTTPDSDPDEGTFVADIHMSITTSPEPNCRDEYEAVDKNLNEDTNGMFVYLCQKKVKSRLYSETVADLEVTAEAAGGTVGVCPTVANGTQRWQPVWGNLNEGVLGENNLPPRGLWFCKRMEPPMVQYDDCTDDYAAVAEYALCRNSIPGLAGCPFTIDQLVAAGFCGNSTQAPIVTTNLAAGELVRRITLYQRADGANETIDALAVTYTNQARSTRHVIGSPAVLNPRYGAVLAVIDLTPDNPIVSLSIWADEEGVKGFLVQLQDSETNIGWTSPSVSPDSPSAFATSGAATQAIQYETDQSDPPLPVGSGLIAALVSNTHVNEEDGRVRLRGLGVVFMERPRTSTLAVRISPVDLSSALNVDVQFSTESAMTTSGNTTAFTTATATCPTFTTGDIRVSKADYTNDYPVQLLQAIQATPSMETAMQDFSTQSVAMQVYWTASRPVLNTFTFSAAFADRVYSIVSKQANEPPATVTLTSPEVTFSLPKGNTARCLYVYGLIDVALNYNGTITYQFGTNQSWTINWSGEYKAMSYTRVNTRVEVNPTPAGRRLMEDVTPAANDAITASLFEKDITAQAVPADPDAVRAASVQPGSFAAAAAAAAEAPATCRCSYSFTQFTKYDQTAEVPESVASQLAAPDSDCTCTAGAAAPATESPDSPQLPQASPSPDPSSATSPSPSPSELGMESPSPSPAPEVPESSPSPSPSPVVTDSPSPSPVVSDTPSPSPSPSPVPGASDLVTPSPSPSPSTSPRLPKRSPRPGKPGAKSSPKPKHHAPKASPKPTTKKRPGKKPRQTGGQGAGGYRG